MRCASGNPTAFFAGAAFAEVTSIDAYASLAFEHDLEVRRILGCDQLERSTVRPSIDTEAEDGFAPPSERAGIRAEVCDGNRVAADVLPGRPTHGGIAHRARRAPVPHGEEHRPDGNRYIATHSLHRVRRYVSPGDR